MITITKRLVPLVATLALALATVGCESTTGGQAVTGVEITTVASTLEVGSTLQLEVRVLPSGAAQGVDWSSSDPELASVSSSGLVEGLLPGEVRIRATSVDDPSKSDELVLAITGCPDPRVITVRVISEDVTWENWIDSPECFDYIVDTNVNNQGSLLTIEPGTIIGFEPHSLVIRGDGGLLAAGTAEDPIVMTSVTPGRGQWNGLMLDGTEHPQNRLEHVTIENAGVGNWSGSITKANLMMINGAGTTLQNVTLRNSEEYGLGMASGSHIRQPDRGGNVLTANKLGPAHLPASMVHFLGEESDLTGNDVDLVAVVPSRIDQATVWPGYAYLILRRSANYAFDVHGEDAHLTLRPGATIVFEEDMGMTVSSGGRLTVDASSDDPVVLTGAEQVPGFWRGLRLFTEGNLLSYVVIEYAGSGSHSGSVERANLFMSEDAEAEVVNSQLLNGAGYGLHARNGASLRLVNNVLSGNQLGPAHVPATIIDEQWRFNDFTGNGRDAIMVATQSITISEPTIWPDVGVPYVIFAVPGGGINVSGASFTVDPGVEIRFGQDMGFSIREGELTVEGTTTDPILLTAEDGGRWQGINIFKSTGSFAYLTLQNAGSSAWGEMSEAGAVTVSTAGDVASTAEIGDEVSQSGADYGLVFGYGLTRGYGCGSLAPVFVHTGDSVDEHCPTG